ncbi:MAG: leucyl aminopeptidase family protein, partial [Boseongicola sp.]
MNALTFAHADTAQVRPLHLVSKEDLEYWQANLSERDLALVKGTGFKASPGQVVLFSDSDGAIQAAAGGLGDARARARKRFLSARIRASLPEGTWRLESNLAGDDLAEAMLGWLLAGYRFDRYAELKPPTANIEAPK